VRECVSALVREWFGGCAEIQPERMNSPHDCGKPHKLREALPAPADGSRRDPALDARHGARHLSHARSVGEGRHRGVTDANSFARQACAAVHCPPRSGPNCAMLAPAHGTRPALDPSAQADITLPVPRIHSPGGSRRAEVQSSPTRFYTVGEGQETASAAVRCHPLPSSYWRESGPRCTIPHPPARPTEPGCPGWRKGYGVCPGCRRPP
jgi:hypothetical protein